MPWAKTPGSADFSPLSNWSSAWQAKLLRSYNGALVALNVTKSGVVQPSLVKTSDIVSDVGQVPTSWDHTVTTNNATENLLLDLQGPIVDACVLGGSLIIYGSQVCCEHDGGWQQERLRLPSPPVHGGCD